jgi:hypothetical protein
MVRQSLKLDLRWALPGALPLVVRLLEGARRTLGETGYLLVELSLERASAAAPAQDLLIELDGQP